MRNLKRTLSLALSATMLSSMMVAGAGAASYADVSSNHHQEAIAVMQAVGVMVGDQNGNFNPDKQVTRAEMAVVMSNLLGLKVEDFKNASIPFTDVPEWARPYVAACYAAGVTSGTSATTYGSNDPVTAVQASLMMMKALATSSTAPTSAATGRSPPLSRPLPLTCLRTLTPAPTTPCPATMWLSWL